MGNCREYTMKLVCFWGVSVGIYSDVSVAQASLQPGLISTEQIVARQLPALSGPVAPPVASNAPESLDINVAVARAVSWHPDIREAVGQLFEQSEAVNVARAQYYPQMNGGMNNGITNSYSDSGYSPSLVLSISQMLYDFGKANSQVRAANAGVAQAQANVLVSIDTVALQVQGYQKLVGIAREQLIALNGISQLARQRSDEGASSVSDVVQTEARIEGARAMLLQYQANLDRWRATLTARLGWDRIQHVSDAFPASLQGVCDVSQPDDQLIPTVLAAYAQANKAQAQLDESSARMLPTISLQPEVTHYLNDWYANSQALDRTQYSAWVKVEVPLYQGGRLTASRNAAAHSLEAAKAAVQNAQLTARQRLTEAKNEAQSLARTLQIQARQQQLGERTRALYQQQYLELGTRPLLDVLNAEQEVFQARFTEQQTLTQLHQLQLDCLYSTGKMRSAFALNNRTIQSVEIQP
ncbi:adhesin transport system outer membrane protein|uniref:Adhesin transport system outer membrane protein n=1 Tax=Brenneria salicis ATCC 15712 = DSM 30166 TaxID=714314 RepID=A0A366HYW4_9GAMM|nr:TolC family outer membrane protein [Brenneria salicis]NMN92594.1 adhesin transport system outer membrane protein [Brenneria salicis ATCC 15712 = DSM 30166]RBP59045.1 adhesin transport system outer membrane protein [Brenneria salicis ATCC 15712 = DSM 30166]RLM29669.1 type I secretion protein TolC [Brenneria salicis ATCC 15712 = DSM 30166]